MTTEEHALKFAERIKNIASKDSKITVNVIDGIVNYSAGDNQFSIPLPDGEQTPVYDEMQELEKEVEKE